MGAGAPRLGGRVDENAAEFFDRHGGRCYPTRSFANGHEQSEKRYVITKWAWDATRHAGQACVNMAGFADGVARGKEGARVNGEKRREKWSSVGDVEGT